MCIIAKTIKGKGVSFMENKAECDKGDKKALESQYLNLPKDHGVYFQDTEQPLMKDRKSVV